MVARKITPGQMRTLHMLKRSLCIDEATYREMLSAFGAESSADLLFADAATLLTRLIADAKGLGLWVDKKPVVREGMANPGQLAKIRAIWDEVSFTEPSKRKKALDAFILSRTGISRIEWLTNDAARKLIPILEAMRKQNKKKKETLCQQS
jgi:hypothetical protein